MTSTTRQRPWVRAALAVSGGLFATASIALGWAFFKLATYVDPWHEKVRMAGYVQKTAQVGQVRMSYVEGPDNGPPLVLLHAQFLDWFSYSRVLPELAKSFHVFDIDYPGHGSTVTPPDYPMTAERIGADLASFIEARIGQPVYLSGNSSGGLLAVWLAARRPELVKAALLEDPPLFSAEFPRIRQTIADRAFKTSAAAVREHAPDFLLYWIRGNATFFRRNVGPGTPTALAAAVRAFRLVHPGQPVEIGLLQNDTVRMLIRGLAQYDPRFGAAFYEGRWNEGFDHAQALRSVRCPVLLLQADHSVMADGTLNGAMSTQEAQRAMSLLPAGQYRQIDATHVVNLDQPAAFVRILEDFFRPGDRQSG